MAVNPKARRRSVRHIGTIVREARGDRPLWQEAQATKVNPDVLRKLETGSRPLTELAGTLVKRYKLDPVVLDRQLAISEQDLLADLPAMERALARHEFIIYLAKTVKTGARPARLRQPTVKADTPRARKARRDSSVGRALV
ncbi:MAG: hypothetical protein M3O87_06400 [Candidatus Dormibacteraeota bacterium]|nr:hypothetical protein [Candidatus Dormibacteraeota bacterium]